MGSKAFGKGVFSFFNFVEDSLPKKDISSMRFLAKRSFAIFDKYVALREVHRELNDQMS